METGVSSETGEVPVQGWRTAFCVLLSFVLLLPGAVLGILFLLMNDDTRAGDLLAPMLVIPVASFGAFATATFLPHLIVRQGADHRTALLIFGLLCVLAAAGLAIDDLADPSGVLQGLFRAPTGRPALYLALGLAAAIGGGLWGRWEATRPAREARRRRPRQPAGRD